MTSADRVRNLCLQMDARDASDLFLSAERPPSFRRHGVVETLAEPPLTLAEVEAFIRECLPQGTWERLQRDRDLDLGTQMGEDVRLRVNLSFRMGSPALVIRRVPSGALSFEALHLPSVIRSLCECPRGLILVTGATGSGKSTTMAAMLNSINTRFARHIVTLEDPIEFVHRDVRSVVTQREIGGDSLDFAQALRHVVRQNPDVIFLGELRDLETIQTAISAAMTGHLVVATFHTVDAEQTLERILNYFPEGLQDQVAQDFSLALQGILSQRLLRTVDGQGRIPAFEILLATPLVRRLVARRELGQIHEVIKENASVGMVDFQHSLLELVRNGDVTQEDAMAAATNPAELSLMLQGMETGADSFRQNADDETTVNGFNLKKLLRDAISYGASDLLLSVGIPPTIRLDGVLQPFDLPNLSPADTRQLLFGVLSPTQRVRFEEGREIDFALSITGVDEHDPSAEYRFRVNGFFQKGRVSVALRLIPMTIPKPSALGLPPVLVGMCKRHQGLVLVTGPTGHGKSTTLAALVNEINENRPCHIITIEDPIEFVHTHKQAIVEQREVGEDTKSFANALKYVLREDPDVILIGEMRDPETIAAALTAAETGHLVFATLHTNDVCQAVDRIIDVFPANQQAQIRTQLAASLECIVSQRLVPRNSPKGGRLAAIEVLVGTPAVRALIRDAKTHQLPALIETSAKFGMITLQKALRTLFDAKLITRDTYLSMLPPGTPLEQT
jgi:pilus retraction protein PilT